MNSLNKILKRCIFSKTSLRTISTTSVTKTSFPNAEEKSRRISVIKEAEKVVGYPTSFLSLRWILNDEVANIASHIRKLVGTNHPLLKTAKGMLLRNEQATWGLIVLLMSKVAGLKSNFSELECDRTADILHSQRIIAEVTEMIKTSHFVHKSLINIYASTENATDLNFGNTLALLCGDYLLSSSFGEIARLKNYHVQETMSSSLRDLAESQFIGLRDDQNQPIPSRPLPLQKKVDIPPEFGVEPWKMEDVLGNMKAEWTLRNILGGASLLGKGCQSSLILANHETKIQELGYIFGRSLALAWQAALEKDLLKEDTFSLVLAPIMFHLEHDPSFYSEIEKGLSNHDNIDYDNIRKVVMNGPGLEKTSQVQTEFSELALNVLDQFPDSSSKTALENIIKSL